MNTQLNKIVRAVYVQEIKPNLAEAYRNDLFLDGPLADMVIEQARLNLGRKCMGEDDSEFYAEEDKVVKAVLAKIESMFINL